MLLMLPSDVFTWKFTGSAECHCVMWQEKAYLLLTCQRLIFRWYREPATENVTSPQVFTAPEVVTRNHVGGNRKPLSLWQRQHGGPNNNMAAK